MLEDAHRLLKDTGHRLSLELSVNAMVLAACGRLCREQQLNQRPVCDYFEKDLGED